MNDRVHPLIRMALAPMYADPTTFDEWNNELFHDLCGKRQGPVIQDLLILLSQLDATKDSFGVSPTRFLEMAVPMLKKLREACKEDFKDL